VNRRDFQELAGIRLREAETLLRANHHAGAYYLAGYVVECALKACIAKRTKAGDFPDISTVRASYTHDLDDLVRVAGLELERDRLVRENRVFALNWGLVKDWTEASRYSLQGKEQAEALIAAVSQRGPGILSWLRNHW
jgi:HEPN domain-containing protein